MKIVEWVDPYTNEALEQTEKKIFNIFSFKINENCRMGGSLH